MYNKLLSLPMLLGLFLGYYHSHAQSSQNMNLLAQWDNNALPGKSGIVYNDIWGYASGGSEYAIVGVVDSILFFDVSDPANPVEVDGVAGGERSLWRDMKSYTHYLYGVADQGGTNEGLIIIDMSYLPDSVHVVKQTNVFFSRAHNIFIDEDAGRLYVAGANTRSNGVIVLDVGIDPENPSQLSSVSLNGGYIHDLYARGDTIYCNHGNSGFYVYDISDASAPVELGSLTSYNEQGYNHACWLDDSGDNIVFTDETHDRGVKTVSVSDLGNIHVRDIFRSALLRPDDTASVAHNPIIKGDRIYLSYYHDGIQIWDMSNPDSVYRLGYYDTEPNNTTYSGYKGAWGVYPLLPSGIILGSDVVNGLFILEYAPAPLAYDDLQLDAYRKGDYVTLEVSSSLPMGRYEMVPQRRAADGRWQRLKGEFSPSGHNRYHYVDSSPEDGYNLYRIRYRATDASRHWSLTRAVSVYVEKSLRSTSFHIRANGDRLLIDGYEIAESRYHFTLFNLLGTELAKTSFEVTTGDDKFGWKPGFTPVSGWYLLRITGEKPGVFQQNQLIWLTR